METIFIWFVTFCVAAAIFLPYYLAFRKQQKEHLKRRVEAEELGIITAQAQYPQIDQNLCIGCGACVTACPEKEVLGVVWGKAHIINGIRCVGHSFCETACPVLAIKVGLGDITARPDIPVLSEAGETTVPGLYIAGELGGLSLIKNAIEQGRKAMEDMIQRYAGKPAPADDIAQVAIVGAGPAGLSAVLTAIEHGASYLLIDRQEAGGTILQYPRRKLVMTQPVVIPGYGKLDKPEYTKEKLLEIWEGIIQEKRIELHSGYSLQRISKENGIFTIVTDRANLKARSVMLALGRRGTPRKLNVAGEGLEKVSYQLIDAQSYNDKHLLVVGGGDSAVEAAIGLARQPGNTVTLSYRKNKLFRIKQKNMERVTRLISQGRIKPIYESTVLKISERSVTLETPDGIVKLENDFVFVFAGGLPPFEMLRTMGIAFGGDAVQLATAG